MWGSKVGAVVLLAGIGLFGAYIPIFLRKCKIERFVCVLNTFAAGAFLGLALFHIMPEAAQTLEKAEFFIYVGRLRTPFNVAFLLIFVGYLVILLCEQVLTIGENHGNSTPPAHSGATTPRSLEGGGGARGQRGGRDGGLRRHVVTDEPRVEMVVVCAPAAAAAKYDSAAEERRDVSTAARGGTAAEEAPAAVQGVTVAAAAEGGAVEQARSRKALLGVSLLGGDGMAAATEVARDAAAGGEADANSSSSKRESVCDEGVKGGGCGLGFPCCLMAEAAAREAAKGIGKDGSGAAGATAGNAKGVDESHLEAWNVYGGTSKGQEGVETRPFASRCCVLQQRQKHPRDSTRASAAGSDADDVDYSETAALDGTSQATAPADGAAGARGKDEASGEKPGKDFCTEGDGECGRVEGPEQQQIGNEGELAEGGVVCVGGEGRQRDKKNNEEHPAAVGGTGQTVGACDEQMLRPPCGGGGSSSTTLFHPPERREFCSISTCEAAAATRDTATNAACDAGSLEAGLAAAAAGGTGSPGGTAVAAAGGKDGIEVATTPRNVLEGDKCAVDRGAAEPIDSRWGAQQQQGGRLRRWCRGLWRRRRANVQQQQQKDDNEETQRKRMRGRLFFCCCRWCPSRIFAYLLPFARELDGGAFFLMAALAIHGLFEGFIVGAESNLLSLWILTCVIAAHKWAESLLLMTQFMERHLVGKYTSCCMLLVMSVVLLMATRISGESPTYVLGWTTFYLVPQDIFSLPGSMTWAWTLIVIFVASSPVGIIVGACVSSESRVAAGVCNALGAGTLLFVAAEVSVQVFTGERKHRLLQLLVYCAGAGMVFGLSLLDIALEPEA